MSTLNVDKVDPSTGTALEIGTSGDTITVPSGATFVVAGTTEITGTNNVQRPNVNPLIINGDMAVAQRSTSVASISSGNGYYTVDRWHNYTASAGTWTSSQEALAADEAYEDGFRTALKWDCTTANGSLSAGSYLIVEQRIEAQDLQLLKFGTSNAEKLTLSFWVKSTKTGTFIIEMRNHDSSRFCSQSYTVDSTDTWEKKVVAFPADTTGAIDNNNSIGLQISWWLAAGTDYTDGTLNTSWTTSVASGNRVVGQVNSADSDSNNFHITGVQMEVGEYTSSTIPPFQHESFGDNLARCQRYFYKTTDIGTAVGTAEMGNITNASLECSTAVPTTMRTEGTVTITDKDGTSNKNNYYSGGWQANGTVNFAIKQGESNFDVNSANASWNANLYVDCEL